MDYSASPDQVVVSTQPQPPPMMMGTPQSHTTVVIQQPGMPQYVAPRMWSSGMCGCFDDMGSCLMGTFCPLCLAMSVASDMGESACVPCCVPGALVVMRTQMRIENKIQGSIMDDCVTAACCCGPCVLCQMAREQKFIRNTRPIMQ